MSSKNFLVNMQHYLEKILKKQIQDFKIKFSNLHYILIRQIKQVNKKLVH